MLLSRRVEMNIKYKKELLIVMRYESHKIIVTDLIHVIFVVVVHILVQAHDGHTRVKL